MFVRPCPNRNRNVRRRDAMTRERWWLAALLLGLGLGMTAVRADDHKKADEAYNVLMCQPPSACHPCPPAPPPAPVLSKIPYLNQLFRPAPPVAPQPCGHC